MRKDKYHPLLNTWAQPSRCAIIKVDGSSGTRSMSESVWEHVGSLLLNIFSEIVLAYSDLLVAF